ncbi:MAG: 16S rRNA (guanine(527)-N(7))-methyltransferase RsmG [Rhodothermus sp.]|nr:16S rRNA (guanine(527)-N(7))-methyltransferase RsmG [Rhodothermus sp.]
MRVSRETLSSEWNPWKRLTREQQEQLSCYARLLEALNRRHNLVSRETLAELPRRHLLHCLALTWRPFPPGSIVVDWGTGGGLPAIPLAIAFPEITVHAVDAVQKKVLAVRTMARRLGLTNLQSHHARAEQWKGETHYSVARATAPLATLWTWHRRVARPLVTPPDAWPPGLLTLKGGDLSEELAALEQLEPHLHVTLWPLDQLLGDPLFAAKYLIHVAPEPESPASVR